MPILNLEFIPIVCHSNFNVLMFPITKEQEDSIDNGETINITTKERVFRINSSNIYCYGEIDFTTDSDDYINLETFNWTDFCENEIHVPDNYDYNNHYCYTNRLNKRYQTIGTFDPARIAQWKHALIGKPKRVMIVKVNPIRRRRR